MQFIQTIQRTIETQHLLPSGQHVIVGVSGGADSVALLRAMHQLGIAPLTVAHLNHQLRGEAADGDEQFVRELADALDLPFVSEKADVRGLANSSGISTEMAAREARHAFFQTIGKDAVIALAHHADDQAETFLLKLARGAGMDGLCGMPFAQQIGTIRLIRPMLDIPRAEIMDWLNANSYDWREDASNQSTDFLRNRVRNIVLPMLEKELNPNIRKTILRTMDILRSENAYVDAASSRIALENTTDTTTLEAAATLAQPLALQRRIVRKWLFDNGAEAADFDAVEKILSLAATATGTAYFELNATHRIVFEYGVLRIENQPSSRPAPQWKWTIKHGTGWKKDHGKGAGILPAEASFNADKVGDSRIEIRRFEPGDRMAPLRMEGHRKLQDIFTDQKIPRAQRPHIPIVVCRGEIIWLPGYRTARGWDVDGQQGNAIHLRIEADPSDPVEAV